LRGPSRIHIGTSGWHYGHWRGPFYPEVLPAEKFLDHYILYFQTVEINNSFYQLPKEKTFEIWRRAAPPGFIFAVKGSRFITHMKKLKDPERSIGKFVKRVGVLKEKLGPILFQLPPRWHFDGERLDCFLKAWPPKVRVAFEFRDPSWFRDETLETLRKHGAAFCMYDLAGFQSPKEVTSDLIYIRLHGPGDKYQGKYSDQTLAGWAGAFAAWAKRKKEIFCYFDNDQAGYAAEDALRLQEMIAKG
jgi:uncharacterized protein YecE (DUF72 family)